MKTNLEKLLADIANNQIPKEDLEKNFDRVAIEILRNSKLVAGKSEYLIREIEFYLASRFYDPNLPDDVKQWRHLTYTHCNERQLEFGEWYLHHYTGDERYFNQTHYGLDITFGDVEKINYCGILLRVIERIEDKQSFNGIKIIVSELKRSLEEPVLRQVAVGEEKLVFDPNSSLHIEELSNLNDKPIYKCRRKLSTQKLTEEQKKYFNMHYCYLNHTQIKDPRYSEKQFVA